MKVSTGDMIRYESKYRWYDMKVSTGDMISTCNMIWKRIQVIWYESKYRWYDMKVSTGDMIRY